MEQFLIHGLFAFLGCIGYGIVFNIKMPTMLYAALGGMLGWLVFLATQYVFTEDIVRYFMASAVVSFYAQKMARIRKAPALLFLVIAFIPLVPGFSGYKIMEHMLIYDQVALGETATYTVKVVLAMATGFLVNSKVLHPPKMPAHTHSGGDGGR